MTPPPEQLAELVDAMDSLLDDMGANSQSVCLYSKAKARIAYEPFRDHESEMEWYMPLDLAQKIVDDTDAGI